MIKTLPFLTFLFSFFSVNFSFSCEIYLADKKFIIDSSFTDTFYNSIIEKSDCSQEIQKNVVTILTNIEGSINREYINEIINKDLSPSDIVVHPTKAIILKASSIIKKELDSSINLDYSNIKFIADRPIVTCILDDDVKIKCHNCSEPGMKNIQIEIFNSHEEPLKIIWATVNLKLKTKVLMAKRDINTLDGRNLNDLVSAKYSFIERPDYYFTKIDSLNFHRLNRNIKQGEFIKKTDLIPLILVKAGERTKVKYSSGNLLLNSYGIAKNSGYIGSKITLYNIKTRKEFVGKIIDFETVTVDL